MGTDELLIAVIPGDGIGGEVTDQAVKVGEVLNECFGTSLRFRSHPYGADHYLNTGEIIPPEVFEEWPKEYDAILLGALGDPRIPDNAHADGILLALRFRLDLYANMRPIKLIHPRLSPLKRIEDSSEIDLVIFRENTEDLYVQMGGPFRRGLTGESAVEISMNTRSGVERIVKTAFRYARENGYDRITMGDKSNVMKYAGRLWQEVYEKTGRDYPEIEQNHMYADNLAMQLVRDPGQFGVIVTSNMFGDILSDIAAEIQGGIGLSPSVNYNPELHSSFLGLFEPVHGSAPDIAGKNIANPMAAIRSLALLLRRAGHEAAFQAVEGAMGDAVERLGILPGLKGNRGTEEIGSFIREHIREHAKPQRK